MKAAKTPVITYQKYQERKNADEPMEVDQGLSKSTHPLDFYGEDYQEIPEPTSFPADYNFGNGTFGYFCSQPFLTLLLK